MQGLQAGASVLKDLQSEMMSLDQIGDLMGETAQAMEYQNEVSAMLSGKLSEEAEEEAEAELEGLLEEAEDREMDAQRIDLMAHRARQQHHSPLSSKSEEVEEAVSEEEEREFESPLAL